jgi:hypothetical protein
LLILKKQHSATAGTTIALLAIWPSGFGKIFPFHHTAKT